ncbi:MAG TPA: hypothetical protein PKA53_02995 [Sphingobacterium sp.]|nr:hypothetical protein [Sphingobacterium sp.]
MKHFRKNYLDVNLFIPMVLLAMMTIFSCSKDKGPQFDTPTLSLGGSEIVEGKIGTKVSIPLNINAGGGAKAVVVFKGGGFLSEIPINRDATQYVYETEVIPTSSGEGDLIEYEFLVSNLDNTDSERVKATIKVETYDKITIGSTSVYVIDVPNEGIVSAGTTIKLIKGRNYYIGESINFAAGSKLTIEEGVQVYMNADASTPIEITIAGEADVVGTATNPVVFTSSKTLLPNGDPQPGDWVTFRLDGTGPSSNNGRVNYLRMEYAGNRAFRLADVGSATNISHIQVFKASGEGVMFSGSADGNARVKYIVATDCEGGSYRLDNTYGGYMQFVIAVSSEHYGAELDDFQLRTQSSGPRIANVTILGPGSGVSNTHGIRYRETTRAHVYNAIVAQFPRRAVRVAPIDASNNVPVEPNDWANSAVFAHSHVFDIGSQSFRERGELFGPGASTPDYHNSTTAIAGIGVADFVPDAEQTSTFNPSTINSFFASAPYVGAVRNANEDWTKGWVKNPDGSIR